LEPEGDLTGGLRRPGIQTVGPLGLRNQQGT